MEKNCDDMNNFEKESKRVLRSSLKSKCEQSLGKDVKRMKTSDQETNILQEMRLPFVHRRLNKLGQSNLSRNVPHRHLGIQASVGFPDVVYYPLERLYSQIFFNRKLKKLDMNYSLVSFCDLSSPAVGMCYIGNNRVAVSLGKKLQFADVLGDIKLSNLVEINTYCKGLTYHDGSIYSVDEKTVLIYTREGAFIRELYRHNTKGAYFQSIAVSDDGRRIYITSWNLGLITIDDSGNHLHTLYEDYLKAPFGICLDDKSNVLICLTWLGRVIEVNSEGRQVLGDVQRSDLDSKPSSLYFERATSSLIVGCGGASKLVILKLEVV